jgi:hypothetical protein
VVELLDSRYLTQYARVKSVARTIMKR